MMASAPSILLTRPSGAAEGFARQLADAGVQGPVVISPLLQIETLVAPDMAGDAIFAGTETADGALRQDDTMMVPAAALPAPAATITADAGGKHHTARDLHA